MHRGYNSGSGMRSAAALSRQRTVPSSTEIPVDPDVPSAPAEYDVANTGDADDPRRRSLPPHFRVLKVTQSYYPFLERGGPAVKVRAMARGLALRGHPVTVLTSDLWIKETANSETITQQANGWRYDEDGMQAVYLSTQASSRSLTWTPAAISFCAQRLTSFNIVHIYCTYDLLGPIVA